MKYPKNKNQNTDLRISAIMQSRDRLNDKCTWIPAEIDLGFPQIYGWMDGWMDGCVGGCMHAWRNILMNGWIDIREIENGYKRKEETKLSYVGSRGFCGCLCVCVCC